LEGLKLKTYCDPEFKGECLDRKNNGVCGWKGTCNQKGIKIKGQGRKLEFLKI
jgi:hypothetical protein